MDAARQIAEMLKCRLDQNWGSPKWDDLVFRFMRAQRGTVVPALTSVEEIRSRVSASRTELDRTLQWLVERDLVIRPYDGDLLLLSPLGYAWLLENGDLTAAKERILQPIAGIVKRRVERSLGPKEQGKLNAKDASYLLLLLLAGARSEEAALRIDRTGQGSAQFVCQLLNHILEQTACDTYTKWTVEQFHSYGRSKNLDKKTRFNSSTSAVRHNDWKEAETPKAWIVDDSLSTLRNLLSAVLCALDPDKVVGLLRRHATRPIYANRKLGDAATAFRQLFGHVDVPHHYRKRLVDVAEELASSDPRKLD